MMMSLWRSISCNPYPDYEIDYTEEGALFGQSSIIVRFAGHRLPPTLFSCCIYCDDRLTIKEFYSSVLRSFKKMFYRPAMNSHTKLHILINWRGGAAVKPDNNAI